MTAVRHINSGVMCNHPGCYDTRYASQLDVSGGSSAVRKALRRQGWKSRRVQLTPAVGGRRALRRTEDYCPAHAEDASS
jgi:hypothetical protein